MPNNNSINCADIKEKLKSFLEDLLSDEEYQAFAVHLDECPKCREYVSAIGSLSNQLWELGNVKVPADLSSTIIFKLNSSDKPSRTSDRRRNIIIAFALIAMAISAAAYLVIANLVKKEGLSLLKTKEQPVSEPKPVTENITLAAAKEEKGSQVKLKNKEQIPAGKNEPREEAKTPVVEQRPMHWHFTYMFDTQRTKLLNTLRELGIYPDYEGFDIVVFSTNSQNIERLSALLPVIGTLENLSEEVRSSGDQDRRVIVYLENKHVKPPDVSSDKDIQNKDMLVSRNNTDLSTRYSLHWHVLSVVAMQSELSNTIRALGGVVDYECPGVIVFRITNKKINALMAQIQSLSGMAAEFGSNAIKDKFPPDAAVNISIVYSRK